MSSPDEPLPAWIELSWPQPIKPTSIQLTFDTGMHRVLTFSLADAYTRKMHWGSAQPETVVDYVVECSYQDQKCALVDIEGNYQRRNRIELKGRPLETLRITVTATGGLDHARVCEVRVMDEREGIGSQAA